MIRNGKPGKNTQKKRHLVLVFLIILFLCFSGSTILTAKSLIQDVVETYGAPSPGINNLLMIKLGYSLYTNGDHLFEPAGNEDNTQLFIVYPNESVYSVAARLEDESYIISSAVFVDYLVYKGYDRSINSGEFNLTGGMTAIDIAEKFHTTSGDSTTFTILAGWRVEEISKAMEIYQFTFTGDQLIQAVKYPQTVDALEQKYQDYPSLEGFLMPGQYKVDKAMTLESFLGLVLEKFNANVTKKMRKNFSNNGLDLIQAVTLASIIEKEAVIQEEAPLIASVFYNRLAAGMKLESDPTVQYSIGYQSGTNSWWKNPLMSNDLKYNSKYNTYLNYGLPPSPICNPGIPALHSVAFPATSNYYYFRAACDNSGKHVFSTTFDEHLSKGCD